MAKQSTKAAENMQNLFDPEGYQNVFKTWGSFNERMTSILVEAATKSTDIAAQTAQESFSNVRDITAVRDEPTEYAKAYGDFLQKQTDLLVRTAKSFGDVTQKAGSETTELANEAGAELNQKVSANVDDATDKATSAAKKAAA